MEVSFHLIEEIINGGACAMVRGHMRTWFIVNGLVLLHLESGSG